MHEQHPQQPALPDPERDQPPGLHPRIWIGSLADYNAGRLHGDWVDAAVDDDTLNASVQTILATSQEPGAEEWGIFDYDEFGAYKPGEYEPLETVAAVARGIELHGGAFAAWAAHANDEGEDLLERLALFDEAYCGHYASPEAWAEELIDSTGMDSALDEHVSEWLRGYLTIDYNAVARDFDLSGEISIENDPSGGIWVFDCRV